MARSRKKRWPYISKSGEPAAKFNEPAAPRIAHPASPILSMRDATIVSLQFGLAPRNQEAYGLRWSSFMLDGRVQIADV